MQSTGTLTAPLGSRDFSEVVVSPFMQRIGLMLMSAVILVNDTNLSNSGADAGGLDPQTLLKLVICGACGLYGVLNLPHTKQLLFRPGAIWVTLFAGWALICVPMAVNISYSFIAIGLLACMILFAPALIQAVGMKRILITAVVILEIYLLGCWAMHFIAPELNGFDPDISHAADAARLGGLSHPNSTAGKATLAIGLILTVTCCRWISFRKLLLPLLFTFVTLLFTGSRTWTGASICIIGLAGWRELNLQSKALVFCGTVVLGSFLGLMVVNEINDNSIDYVLAGFSRSGKSDEIYSMTGRSDLWSLCVEKIAESPIWGYGYGCQRFVIEDHFWVTRHAHNLVLNTTLGCGFVGAALLLLLLGSQLPRAILSNDFFPVAMLIMLVIGGLTDNPIFNPMPSVIMLFLLLCLSAPSKQEQIVAEPVTEQRSD